MTPIRYLLFLFALVTAAAGADQRSHPGNFVDGEKSLHELIEFPELRGDTSVDIGCIAVLTTRGRLDKHGCYQRDPGDQTFIALINRAARKARLEPAAIDGSPVPVVFQYRVEFEKKGETETVELFANPGYTENVEAYGKGHIAAQRVWGRESWQKDCPQHNRFLVLVRANVDWEGRPSAVSIEHADGLPIIGKCEEALTQNLLDSRFVPAFADGEPVPSTYVEPFGN